MNCFFVWNVRKITKSKYEYVKVVCFSHFCSFFPKCTRDLFTLFMLPAHWSRSGHKDLKSTKRFKTGPELLLGQCCCMMHTWRAFVSSFYVSVLRFSPAGAPTKSFCLVIYRSEHSSTDPLRSNGTLHVLSFVWSFKDLCTALTFVLCFLCCSHKTFARLK